MNGEVFVFDDIINLTYQTKIKELMMNKGSYNNLHFPWYVIKDISCSEEYEDQGGRFVFIHNFAVEEGISSQFHPFFLKLIQNSCKKINLKKVEIHQGSSILELPSFEKDFIDDPYASVKNSVSMIYFVTDSDGDVIIYNEKEKSKSYTIKKKISPKQGRVILFDGELYHVDEEPNEYLRCTVNYDFIDLSND
jgi:hypothetical protein|tara:strand:+ start:44 stop:622 length:579 start_codon:yes stop_codon:yes gene_type:complete